MWLCCGVGCCQRQRRRRHRCRAYANRSQGYADGPNDGDGGEQRDTTVRHDRAVAAVAGIVILGCRDGSAFDVVVRLLLFCFRSLAFVLHFGSWHAPAVCQHPKFKYEKVDARRRRRSTTDDGQGGCGDDSGLSSVF